MGLVQSKEQEIVEDKKVEKKEEIKIEIDSKIEDVLTNYYKEKKKEKYLAEDLKNLDDQRLIYVSDWKKLSQELRSRFPAGLISDLDEIAGIKKDVRRIKTQTGGIRNGVGPNINSKNRTGHYNRQRRGKEREKLGSNTSRIQLESNSMGSNFNNLLESFLCWFHYGDSILQRVPNNTQLGDIGISNSERNKGLYQRLDEQEVTLRKRVKSKGCK